MPDWNTLLDTPQKVRTAILCGLVALATLAAVIVYAVRAPGPGPEGDVPPPESGAASAAPQESASPEPSEAPEQSAGLVGLVPALTIDEARALALADAGVSEAEAEVSREALAEHNGIWVYEFRFRTQAARYEYTLNANSGEVRTMVKETADASGPKHLDVTLTRAKFNELTAHLVEATMGPVRQAMSDAGLSGSDISKVLLVGGSSRIPAVQEAVKKITGKDGFKGINPDECVAMGAAIQAGVLTGDVEGLLLLDVTPLSLGIETMGGVCTKLIERNTTIPVRKSQIFSTAADNQTSVEVNVLQGEREMAAANKSLGRFHLDGIAPARRGVPQIEVTFDVDANGIVNVTAKDLGTGKSQNITITASTNLSDEEIDKAVKDAERYAEEDKKRKEEIDNKNNLESMIDSLEKTVKEAGDKLSEDDKKTVEDAVAKAKGELESGDNDRVKAALETLQTEIQPVIAKMYQQAGGAQGAPDNNGGDDDTEFRQH